MPVEDDLERDVDVVCRPNFKCSPQKEAPDANVSRSYELLNEQTANKESAKNKEEIHSDEANMFPDVIEGVGQDISDRNCLEVVLHNGKDRDTPHEVQLNRSLR